jgi:hypothetical protein
MRHASIPGSRVAALAFVPAVSESRLERIPFLRNRNTLWNHCWRISLSANRKSTSPGNALAGAWRKVIRDLFDPYRPELYYMRSPGPKWRAKHGTTASR